MRIGPLRFEPQRGFELFHSLLGVTLIFQRQRQIVMCFRVVGFEVQRLMIARNGLVPGFVARKLDGPLTVALRRLRSRYSGESQRECHCRHDVRSPVSEKKSIRPAALHGDSLARGQNPREMQSLRRTSVVVKSPEEFNAKLSNPRSTGTANNPKRRVADVSPGICKLRVVEDVEKFDTEIESQILFNCGVL